MLLRLENNIVLFSNELVWVFLLHPPLIKNCEIILETSGLWNNENFFFRQVLHVDLNGQIGFIIQLAEGDGESVSL